jgi:hypothetical protein
MTASPSLRITYLLIPARPRCVYILFRLRSERWNFGLISRLPAAECSAAVCLESLESPGLWKSLILAPAAINKLTSCFLQIHLRALVPGTAELNIDMKAGCVLLVECHRVSALLAFCILAAGTWTY